MKGLQVEVTKEETLTSHNTTQHNTSWILSFCFWLSGIKLNWVELKSVPTHSTHHSPLTTHTERVFVRRYKKETNVMLYVKVKPPSPSPSPSQTQTIPGFASYYYLNWIKLYMHLSREMTLMPSGILPCHRWAWAWIFLGLRRKFKGCCAVDIPGIHH